jgi:hypothetical protein
MPLFDISNLPYWILLGMGVALFLFVIVSGGGDGDGDADVDSDADVGGDADADGDGDFNLAQTLGWLGIGKAPLILLLATDLSLWGLLGWMANVGVGGGAIVLVGALMGALVLGGQIAKPVGKIFTAFGEETSGDRLIGCVGSVSTARIPLASEGKVGQVDVLDSAHNLVTVNAILPDWATVIPERGIKVLVIERTAEGYVVICQDSSDQDHWFSTHNSH